MVLRPIAPGDDAPARWAEGSSPHDAGQQPGVPEPPGNPPAPAPPGPNPDPGPDIPPPIEEPPKPLPTPPYDVPPPPQTGGGSLLLRGSA